MAIYNDEYKKLKEDYSYLKENITSKLIEKITNYKNILETAEGTDINKISNDLNHLNTLLEKINNATLASEIQIYNNIKKINDYIEEITSQTYTSHKYSENESRTYHYKVDYSSIKTNEDGITFNVKKTCTIKTNKTETEPEKTTTKYEGCDSKSVSYLNILNNKVPKITEL